MLLSRKKLFAFGFAAIGTNLLNLTIGVYLCDAMLTAGFMENIANWTYLGRDAVVASVWAVLITVSKVIDGIIDIPFANFLDNLKSKFGKRRMGILLGFVPLLVSFLLFLLPITKDKSMLNTFWFGLLLLIFYCSYTCTMLAYYACFSEITRDDKDRRYLSNVKSVADVIYFILVFALMPVLINFMNIRVIALIFSPLSLLIIICLFLLKGEAAEGQLAQKPAAPVKSPGVVKSFVHTCKNKDYMRWMIVFVLNVFGIQMFLTGQNVYLSGAGIGGGSIAIINACAFGPVPITMVLYNYIIKRKGFRFGYLYAMLTFTFAMAVCALLYTDFIRDSGPLLLISIIGGLICSLGIGTFFSIVYLIPSHLAAREKEESGYSQPSMYFAIQGVASAVVTAVSTGVVWVNMKTGGLTYLMTIVVGVFLLLSCIATVVLPKSFSEIGKETRS